MKRADVWIIILSFLVLGLCAECAYQRGVDETIEWYEDEESEGVWEVSSSLMNKSEQCGKNYSAQMLQTRSQQNKSLTLA